MKIENLLQMKIECWRKKINANVNEKINICVDHEINYCVADKINASVCFGDI